jgi:hypothetical protein
MQTTNNSFQIGVIISNDENNHTCIVEMIDESITQINGTGVVGGTYLISNGFLMTQIKEKQLITVVI